MWTTPESTLQNYVKYYRSIQRREGDKGLRETLSAHRDAVQLDRQMSPDQKTSLLAIYDHVEATLLPSPPSPSTSSSD